MPAADTLHRELRAAAAAIAFLTRVPIGRLARLGEPDLAAGSPIFPVVGGCVGLAAGGVATALGGTLPPLTVGALALTVATLLTGAMHLDALADAADALGADSRGRALEIMRDPRSGAYGVTAVVLLAITEAGALGAGLSPGSVAAAFALSRATAPVVACALPYARAGCPGLGRALAGRHRSRAAVGFAVGSGIAVATAPRDAAALVLASASCAAMATVVCCRRFGGVTGDLLGATIAVTEAVCVVVAAASPLSILST